MIKKIINKFLRYIYTFHVQKKAKKTGYKIFINGFSKVNKNTILGNNIHFNGMKILGNGEVDIGDNFHSGFGCKIITGIHNYEKADKLPYDSLIIEKNVIIGENVWIGLDVTILGGVKIGEGAIIQAGSVVVSNIPALGIAGGHPAKVFKFRDKVHYEKIKKEKRFF